MRQIKDFHHHARLIYRACRILYGKELTQDECLRIFKIVFPHLNELKKSSDEYASASRSVVFGLIEIARDWSPEFELKDFICYTIGRLCLPSLWRTDELIKFYEDILVVVMRIRKLTPRECFRLMGVSDNDIDKLLSCGISNSACYKLAGNSIVVDVMTEMFLKMFVNTGEDKEEGTQLLLF